MSNERKSHSGIEINGWRALKKEKPTSHEIKVWREYASILLREIKFNTEDYLRTEPREALLINHFGEAIDPILVIGLLNKRARLSNADFFTYYHAWNLRRDVAGLRGYTIPEFKKYIEGNEREKIYQTFLEEK